MPKNRPQQRRGSSGARRDGHRRALSIHSTPRAELDVRRYARAVIAMAMAEAQREAEAEAERRAREALPAESSP